MTKRPWLVWALLIGVAGSLAAQEATVAADQTEADEDPFFEAIDVNVVNVEVFVSDKAGRPVTGLGREDFEIFEDRRPVEITNFYAVEGARVKAPAAPETPSGGLEDSPSTVPIRVELPALPESQRLFLIVYVDNFNIRPLNRNRVFRRLREFLHDQAGLADQVMLVSYDRALNIRQPFTSDLDLIARGLFELEEMTGHAVRQDAERREVLEAIDRANDSLEVEWRITQFAESLSSDLSFTLSALGDFIESLSGLEGRKAILYVSDGLPMTPGEELFQALVHKFAWSGAMTRMQDYSAHRSFKELTASANSARVSFYTIDAAGLRGSMSSKASSRGLETPGLPTLVDSSFIHNVQGPLRFMAEETGGRAIVNSNDILPGLEGAASDFQNFYSLGYTASHLGDGRYHRIKVEVKDRKGLRVRHRAGYRDKSLASRMADGTRSMMLYGFGSNPLGVGLEVGKGSEHERDLFIVPVRIDVPIGSLELVPQGEFFVGRVRLFINAVDQEGGMAETQQVPLSIRIPKAEIEHARSQPYVYFAQLQMRGGSQRLALGVRDEIGSTESFLIKIVSVGSA